MALPNELHPLQLGAGSASAYQIEQSLRFDGSSYLNWTSPASAGDRQTWTLSFWHKRSEIGTGTLAGYQTVLAAPSGSGDDAVRFDTSNKFKWFVNDTGDGYLDTTALYRDFSAWSHYVVVADYSNSTASERVRMFINGERITDSSYSAPSTSFQGGINNSVAQVIGIRYTGSTYYLKGYLAEFHFLDGTAVTNAEDFGEYDTSGVWRPIEYTGTYGTNGYYLKFDPTAANGIGHDHSGNGNNFNSNGFTTSGPGTDVMNDTPTTNYATLNPLLVGYSSSATKNVAFTEGNLRATFNTTSGWQQVATSSINFSSGKWYAESYINNEGGTYPGFGIGEASTLQQGNGTGSLSVNAMENSYHYSSTGSKVSDDGSSSYGSTWTTGDIIGIAIDCDNNKIWWSKNGTWQASGDPSAGTNAAFTIASGIEYCLAINGWSSGSQTLNFGQREFAHPPGTSSATDYFNAVTYTGTSATQAITGVGFQPDFVWIKHRNGTGNHNLFDSVRGTGKQLYSNLVDGEGDFATSGLTAFGTDGFTLGNSVNSDANINNNTYVAWCWKAGGTASSNTDGSTTSSVSANQDAGFSVVTYTGTGANATVGHGLGVAPKMVICKSRNSSSHSWYTYHESLGSTKYVYLNLTAAAGTGAAIWNGDPTSTTFTLGNSNGANQSTVDYVAYCFAEKTGVSKFGTYEGTSATNSIDVGFKPALVMIKNADASSQWMMVDTERGSHQILNPNRNVAEFTSSSSIRVNLTSSGFILNGNGTDTNVSGNTYIYAAFAENFSADSTYKSLNTANLPAPTIKDGSDNFITQLGYGHQILDKAKGAAVKTDVLIAQSQGTTSGLTTSWTCPAGVTSIDAWVLGAGGSGNVGSPSIGGGGGGLAVLQNYSVTPGQSYSITLGGSCPNDNGCSGGATSAFGATANGGQSQGNGGTATGGDQNYTGSNRSGHIGGAPGNYPNEPIYQFPWTRPSTTPSGRNTASSGRYGYGAHGNAGYDQSMHWAGPGAVLIQYEIDSNYEGFPYGLWWTKNRNDSDNHQLSDSVRGTSSFFYTNSNASEASSYTTPFGNSVSWAWKASNTTSSNTDGTISSTVSVNPSAGFSIVSYTGNNTDGATVGHGLGVEPAMVIIKARTVTGRPTVLHKGTTPISSYSSSTTFTLTSYTNALFLDLTSGNYNYSFDNQVNGSSPNTYIAYCFSEVENYSRFGKYTGNGSADGPFVYCGFRPAWILIKRTGGADDWFMYDTARDEYNQAFRALDGNTTDSEKTSASIPIDILSNGFKIRSSGTAMNGSGETIIFAAFAENPFGGDGVSPATAR